MARQRMIHPNFFIDDDVALLSPWSRLLFLSLLTQADREGRLEDKPGRIKAQAFPFDSVDIGENLSNLVANGFIVRYEGQDGRKCIQIRSFLKYQKPHHKEEPSKLPPCMSQPCIKHEPSKAERNRKSSANPPETETVPKTESETEQSVRVDPTCAAEPGAAPLDVQGVPLPPIEVYGSTLTDIWHELRGSPFPQPGPADFLTLSDWHSSGIPIRIVERGMRDCIQGLLRRKDRPAGKPLSYFNGAVREAYGQWRKAIA